MFDRTRLSPLEARLGSASAHLRSRAHRAAALRIIAHVGLLRSLRYSARFGGPVLIARGSIVRLERKAKIRLCRRSVLLVGFEHVRRSLQSFISESEPS